VLAALGRARGDRGYVLVDVTRPASEWAGPLLAVPLPA
jgi:hypothetical protein